MRTQKPPAFNSLYIKQRFYDPGLQILQYTIKRVGVKKFEITNSKYFSVKTKFKMTYIEMFS